MNKDRITGLDLFRIILAFLVVLVHSCTYSTGAALENLQINTTQYYVGWLIFALSIPAVNSFAVLSGFVGYGHKHGARKGIRMWFELLYYSVLITLVFAVFSQVTKNEIFDAFIPLTNGHWWYINTYILVSVSMPVLDYIVEMTEWKIFRNIIGIFILLICGSNALCLQKDVWFLNNGYSPWWIAFLYIVGAGIKKYDIPARISHNKWGLLWIVSVILTAASRFVIENITQIVFGKTMGGGLLFNYLSISVLISSITSLCFFATLNIKPVNRILSQFATCSFAAYIIHVHPIIISKFLKGRYSTYGETPVLSGTVRLILTSIIIVLVCSVLDLARAALFKKVEGAIDRWRMNRKAHSN